MVVDYFKPLTWHSFQTTEILFESVDRGIENGAFRTEIWATKPVQLDEERKNNAVY